MGAPKRSDRETRELIVRLAVLYRIQRGVEKIGVLADNEDQRFVEEVANRLLVEGFLERDGDSEYMRLTAKGREVIGQMISVFDRSLQLNIFARFLIDVDLPEDMADGNGRVFGNLFDPRFGQPDEPTNDSCVDMRLAMLHFLAETNPNGPQEFDPYVVVLLQKLMDGELESPTFWQDLRIGRAFQQIKEIIETAKTWRSMHSSKKRAQELMQGLYEAGMLELMKREGSVCSACGGALAIFEKEAREYQEPFEACPNCDAVFGPPPDLDVVGDCPACGTEIRRGQAQCRGCGARINYALPAGTVEHGTETTTTVVEETDCDYAWTGGYGYYGYTPVCYYDPYGYPNDLFLTGLVVGAILF